MSKCISGQGEYGDHTPGDEEFVCGRCYVVDEEAMRAEIERLRAALTAADRPSITDNARAEAERNLAEIARDTDLTFEWGAGYKAGFREGAEWAAGRAETTTATDEDAARLVRQYIDVPFSTALVLVHALAAEGLLATARTDTTKETDR